MKFISLAFAILTGILLAPILLSGHGSAQAGSAIPLSFSESNQIKSLASKAGYPMMTKKKPIAWETSEDSSKLYVSLSGTMDFMLVDLAVPRAVVVDVPDLAWSITNGGNEQEVEFLFIDPGLSPEVQLIVFEEDGSYGAQETLDGLGLTNESVEAEKQLLCNEPCVEHDSPSACLSCTGVVLLKLANPGAPSQ